VNRVLKIVIIIFLFRVIEHQLKIADDAVAQRKGV